jgi:hypothetical protein
MNDYIARKTGEVLAFAETALNTLEKGKSGFEQILDPELFSTIRETNADHKEQIAVIADEFAVAAAVNKKAEMTGKKLQSMRDLYVGEEWNNPAELLEWSGFFEGAAIVHWQLVEGAAEALHIEKLQELAASAIEFHQDLLETVSIKLRDIGIKKAQAQS